MLQFHFEWEDPMGARGDELRATWSSFDIQIGQRHVTRVIDGATNAFRTKIYLPLYPLAEWFVNNWWPLRQECMAPGRDDREYSRRHNILFASEGFALPSLTFQPAGDVFRLIWSPRNLSKQRLQFTDQGYETVSMQSVEDCLMHFVSSVVARLEDRGVSGTTLQIEWSAIQALTDDESVFCNVAGALGLDPLSVPEELSDEMIRVSNSLPSELRTEFFDAASGTDLTTQADWVMRSLDSVKASHVSLGRFADDRRELENGSNEQPWDAGYRTARWLRSKLGLSDHRKVELDDIATGLGNSVKAKSCIHSAFDAVADFTDGDRAAFLTRSARPETQRFAVARGLSEFLDARKAHSALITSSINDRQQRNRAFAAEFLAPASLIAKSVSGSPVTIAEVADIAQDFGVSPHVIEHQIKNHGIGHVLKEFAVVA